MEILYLLIPIALCILALAIKMLFWAVKSGQYDDLDKEGQRILFDDDHPQSIDSKKTEEK
jgi:cbb3-type cytochrome oxidase maturation protein